MSRDKQVLVPSTPSRKSAKVESKNKKQPNPFALASQHYFLYLLNIASVNNFYSPTMSHTSNTSCLCMYLKICKYNHIAFYPYVRCTKHEKKANNFLKPSRFRLLLKAYVTIYIMLYTAFLWAFFAFCAPNGLVLLHTWLRLYNSFVGHIAMVQQNAGLKHALSSVGSNPAGRNSITLIIEIENCPAFICYKQTLAISICLTKLVMQARRRLPLVCMHQGWQYLVLTTGQPRCIQHPGKLILQQHCIVSKLGTNPKRIWWT